VRVGLVQYNSNYVTGCCFAPLSQGVTTLQHSQSPGCTGCLLPGCLTITRVGLSATSRRCLSGHTSDWFGAFMRWESSFSG